MNAAQARREADIVNFKDIEDIYIRTHALIERAAGEGKYDIFIYGHMPMTTVNRLLLEGYKVDNNYDHLGVTISW